MFDRIAPSYDLLNRLLSLGNDRRWRRKVAAAVALQSPQTIIDVAAGTADESILIARRLPEAHVTAVDFSEAMLAVAAAKIAAAGLEERISTVVADAVNLPVADSSADCMTVVFGIRNFQDRAAALAEFFRVLRKDGTLCIMEFSMPDGKLFDKLYRLYQRCWIPLLGRIVSHDRDAYRYLPESIPAFAKADLEAELSAAGFGALSARRLSGGIATIYTCQKR